MKGLKWSLSSARRCGGRWPRQGGRQQVSSDSEDSWDEGEEEKEEGDEVRGEARGNPAESSSHHRLTA